MEESQVNQKVIINWVHNTHNNKWTFGVWLTCVLGQSNTNKSGPLSYSIVVHGSIWLRFLYNNIQIIHSMSEWRQVMYYYLCNNMVIAGRQHCSSPSRFGSFIENNNSSNACAMDGRKKKKCILKRPRRNDGCQCNCAFAFHFIRKFRLMTSKIDFLPFPDVIYIPIYILYEPYEGKIYYITYAPAHSNEWMNELELDMDPKIASSSSTIRKW